MSRSPVFVELVKRAFPGRFLAARATRVPALGRLIERLLFEGDRILYLPRDRVIPVNEAVPAPDQTVLPSQVLDYFIERASTHWIMNTCICRSASKCKDYPIELGCLFLGEAALGIDSRLGHRATKEEALDHARRCREAGLVHMVGRNKLDTVWLGIGPGDRLLTICHCCPCCCLWRVLPYLAPHIASKVTSMPGVTVSVSDRCVGCATCTHGVCFVNAIHVAGGRAMITDACRGCGRCVEVCPERAIELSLSGTGVVEASIARIAPLVDVS